jgi:cysteine synthase A
MMGVVNNYTDLIGKTPIIKLNKIEEALESNVLYKLENFNPLSSVKDRIGLAMIEDAEKKGLLNKDIRIVEPTSGNTGIALAFIAASKGYKITIVMPESMSIERRKLMKMFGAELVLTPAEEGMAGAIHKADEICKQDQNTFMPGQFSNPANPRVHELTTGPEIWEDTNGEVDYFIAGVGTGGTLTGVGKYLKSKNPNIKIIAVEPDTSPVLSKGESGSHRIQGIGAGFVPEILDRSIIDEVIIVTSDDAGEASRRLAKKEGILVGISAGANLWAALQVAKRAENKGKTIVTVACDTGERYLSTWLFDE